MCGVRHVGTSRITVCVLFALPLLSSVGICAGRPVRVQLHVQLSLPSRQLIILGLFLSPQRVPLPRENQTLFVIVHEPCGLNNIFNQEKKRFTNANAAATLIAYTFKNQSQLALSRNSFLLILICFSLMSLSFIYIYFFFFSLFYTYIQFFAIVASQHFSNTGVPTFRLKCQKNSLGCPLPLGCTAIRCMVDVSNLQHTGCLIEDTAQCLAGGRQRISLFFSVSFSGVRVRTRE